ncbi:bifunctional hydroxymethylpyrimidine kinase/phosphomethylpyrimidine kinase [Nocardioides sp. AN3]
MTSSARFPTPPVVLTIAGTDSGGGAGIAADLATFSALGVHGACAVTTVTAQDTTAVHRIHAVPVDVLEAQLDAVLTDLPVAAVKTGLLGSVAAVVLVARLLTQHAARHGAPLPLVVDPVLRATTGVRFADNAVIEAYRHALVPLASVVTPNRAEAEALGPLPVPVVLTGSETATDVLQIPGAHPIDLPHDPVETVNDHGTGCTFSAALAAHLAHGQELADAARLAGDFTATQLRVSAGWTLGRGRGPIAHLVPPIPTRPSIPTTPSVPTRPPPSPTPSAPAAPQIPTQPSNEGVHA